MSVLWLMGVLATAAMVAVERGLGRRVVVETASRFGVSMSPSEGPSQRLLREHTHARPKHPVIFIPGVVSAGLEAWTSLPCARVEFRARMWASLTMVQKALL